MTKGRPCFNDFGSPPLVTLMVIPTGIGCSIGGFAGDAIPAARLLAASSGCLITHPNVMNAGSLYWSDKRIQYVEGYSLDRFAVGEIGLRPVRQQRIGLLFDAGIETELRQRHLQVADGCLASLGLNIGPCVTTKFPLQVKLSKGRSGSSWGNFACPDELIKAGEELKKAGATAIAVVTRFPDNLFADSTDSYRSGEGVDELAGAEAVISHLLVRHLRIPCAHAPALKPLPMDPRLDPRAAGEEIGLTFFPSVLVGLSRAPDLIDLCDCHVAEREVLLGSQVEAVVVPEGALGGEAVLACISRGVKIIVVNNPGILKVNIDSLMGKYSSECQLFEKNFLYARSYLEAAGFLTLLREGIHPSSLDRPLISFNQRQ